MVFDLNIPTSWNELSASNVLYIGNYWQSWQLMLQSEVSMVKAKALLFLQLTGIKEAGKLKKLCVALSKITDETLPNTLALTDFVFEKRDLTKNVIPLIKVSKGKTFQGPADNLGDISIDEFSFAFALYSLWHKTNDQTFLSKLAGVLYRPVNENFEKDGKTRVPFNNGLIDKYAAEFEKLPDGYRNFVYLFFCGCLDRLVKKFPEIFNSDNNQKSGGSFNDTIVEMSGQEFGTWEETKRMDLHVVLRALQRKIIANQTADKK